MSSELSGDGKAARLTTATTNSRTERAAAFRFICRNTKTREQEDEALWMAGLHYKPEPR